MSGQQKLRPHTRDLASAAIGHCRTVRPECKAIAPCKMIWECIDVECPIRRAISAAVRALKQPVGIECVPPPRHGGSPLHWVHRPGQPPQVWRWQDSCWMFLEGPDADGCWFMGGYTPRGAYGSTPGKTVGQAAYDDGWRYLDVAVPPTPATPAWVERDPTDPEWIDPAPPPPPPPLPEYEDWLRNEGRGTDEPI